MKYDGEVEVQPGERILIEHEFAPAMQSGDTVLTATVTAVLLSDASDVTSSVIPSGSVAKSSTSIQYGLEGGADGEEYHVTIEITTDRTVGGAGNVTLQADHYIVVKER